MEKFHVLIVGGGGTGGALAHDLALRGFKITLVERGEVTSGTTGRHHGLIHSGGRYAVEDKESAVECIEENRILRKIMPGAFEENDGLFVAITDENVEYSRSFVEGCAECGIPTLRLTKEETLQIEPNLNPDLKFAVQVPDATMDAMRMALAFFAAARHKGAVIKPFTEVIGVLKEGNNVSGVQVTDHTRGKEYDIGADIVINAAGPWSGRIADMVGCDVPIRLSPGVMLALRGRLCNMVINRLAPSGDGDIIVPQRGLSVVGTTSWVVDDPDDLGLPKDHVQKMYDEGAKLIPLVKEAPFRAAWAAVRPLIGLRKAEAGTGRELSRTFKCFDHLDEGVEGFITITGGKATTARGMAEAAADLVCQKLGVDVPCRTHEEQLLSFRVYYN
jgi:glycerol-3-phosphate dehydrogenase